MFGFDLSKMILVGIIALVVVGPKELPTVLRTLGRVLTRLRRLRTEFSSAAEKFIADADGGSIDGELAVLDGSVRNAIARDPAIAMRGSLPNSEANPPRRLAGEETLQYASAEMQAYLSPLPEETKPAVAKAVVTP